MPISQAIFEIMPVGEENAVSGRLLWKQLGMWSVQSVKHKLNQLAAEGLIERKSRVGRTRRVCISDRELKRVTQRMPRLSRDPSMAEKGQSPLIVMIVALAPALRLQLDRGDKPSVGLSR